MAGPAGGIAGSDCRVHLFSRWFPMPESTEPTDPRSAPRYFLGIDVGGTNVKLGLVGEDGGVASATAFPTGQERGPEFALDQCRLHLQDLAAQAGIAKESIVAAGLGTPGSMDIAAGLILEPSNLPGWRNFPVRDRLSAILEMPVFFTNDANAAAYGEFWAGAGRQYRSLVFFTLGTGVGGGIIVDDMTIEGTHSLGAELGHIHVDFSQQARLCSCGQRGHLEAYASATGLLARCRERLEASASGCLAEIPPDQLSTLRIAEAAEKGDALALSLVLETADWIARGVALTAHVIDPEVFMIGGAMTFGGNQTAVGRRFIARLHAKTCDMVFPAIARHLKIEFASLGSDAGFIGAAGIARVGFLKGTLI